jgi:hypothetical protein
MNYFISYYDKGISYSPNWYGTLSYAPKATILMYDDNEINETDIKNYIANNESIEQNSIPIPIAAAIGS